MSEKIIWREMVSLQIDYVEYDINRDGLEDYIVLLSGCDNGSNAGMSADILLRQEDGEFIWVSMPVSGYNEGLSGNSPLYVAYQGGAPNQYYAIYGLRDGQYEKELYEMVLSVADGSLEYEAMLRWVLEHQE